MSETENSKTRVVVIKDDDKFKAFDQVIEQTNFLSVLDSQWQSSGKHKVDFLIAIKPNLMMAYTTPENDPSTITDPELVEFLIDKIVDAGYTRIAVVESQNVFGNWFENRDVLSVAKYVGYNGKNYKIIDITEEKVPYDYGGRLGNHFVGLTWRDADFRVSFAKNKTHFSCYFTLTLKNLYGCTPLQNKFKEYHKKREWDWPTIEMLKHFWVHFGFIDAFWSADGIMGLKYDVTPEHTKTILGGENIIAVEAVGAQKMGHTDPMKSRIYKLAVEAFGEPTNIEVIGDTTEYPDWRNIPPLVDKLVDKGEEFYNPANLMGFITSDMDDYFKPKIKNRFLLAVRKVLTRILRIFSRADL